LANAIRASDFDLPSSFDIRNSDFYVAFEEIDIAEDFEPECLLHINEALERLAAQDSTKAKVVKLRFFGGLENREIAEVLGISERTVERAWRFARAWLTAELGADS